MAAAQRCPRVPPAARCWEGRGCSQALPWGGWGQGPRNESSNATSPWQEGKLGTWGYENPNPVSPPSTTQPPRLGRTQQPFLAFRPTKHQQLSAFGMGLSAHSPFGDRILGVSKHLKIPSSPPRILRHIGTHQSSAPTAGGVGACRDLTPHQSSPGDWGHGAGDPWHRLSFPVATSPSCWGCSRTPCDRAGDRCPAGWKASAAAPTRCARGNPAACWGGQGLGTADSLSTGLRLRGNYW